ncbi:MAG: carbon-nitrogen hydrolase family protein [Thermoleophilia bacterium]
MKVAAAQIDVVIGEPESNLANIVRHMASASAMGIELLVFPECATSGYMFESRDEAAKYSDSVPGDTTRIFSKWCREYSMGLVIGMLEHDDDTLYNTACLVSSDGILGKYRKTHLIHLGVDRFVARGNQLECHSFRDTLIGVLICYDHRFPEAARSLALRGAQLLVQPSNLPRGAEAYGAFINRTRACENRVFSVSANRVGEERGAYFIGGSQIMDYRGEVIAEGDSRSEQLVVADIDLSLSECKHVVQIPGEYEFDLWKDRRPDLYQALL